MRENKEVSVKREKREKRETYLVSRVDAAVDHVEAGDRHDHVHWLPSHGLAGEEVDVLALRKERERESESVSVRKKEREKVSKEEGGRRLTWSRTPY